MPSHNALKRDAGGKKGKLLCCKHIFDRIRGNLAEIQPKNHQNVHKTHFLQRVPGVNGLNKSEFQDAVKLSYDWTFPICPLFVFAGTTSMWITL